MLKSIAQNTFESYQKLRQLALDTESRYLTSADEVDEKLGYITDSVIHRIMYCLDIVDSVNDMESKVDYFGIISDCIKDGDSFEYMMKSLEFKYEVGNE